MPAARWCTSTKWTSAPASTRWSPTTAGRRWASIPSTTLHDVRWGEHYKGESEAPGKSVADPGKIDAFVWLLQISGAAPANHFVGGYAGAISERQPAMYFPLGGGSLKGIGKPGEIVWSRVFVEGGALHADLGRGTVVSLPAAETERRWRETTMQWPIVHAILHGVSQNQMMARHRANHVNVAYAPSAEARRQALATKAAMLAELGVQRASLRRHAVNLRTSAPGFQHFVVQIDVTGYSTCQG